MQVLILGSTGLVGSELLPLLLKDETISSIHCINRKTQHHTNPKIKEWIGTYEDLPHILEQLPQIKVLYSCLGTTKSQTPDTTLYRQLEVEYPVNVAQALLSKGLEQCHYISALGASIHSNIFYSRTKAEAEEALIQVGVPRLYLYRPSLIVGPRKDTRVLEKVSAALLKIFNPLLLGSLKKYQSIQASTIAQCMWLCTHRPMNQSVQVIASDEIKAITKH